MMQLHRSGLATFLPIALLPLASLAQEQANPQHSPLNLQLSDIQDMRVVLRGRQGGFTPRDNCPQISTYTSASFTGGTYTAQGGFAENEIAAVSYTLPGSMFPLKITQIECIFAQQAAAVTTTTQWSVLMWDGLPNTGTLVAEFSSDGTTLPHIIMGPGTRGTNVTAQVDPNDPEQVFILNPNNDPTHTFSVGFRIDHHNAQTANPCFTAPPATMNAFPVTDNTVIGCGSGYAALNFPNENWLFGVNCGPNGCPPNGGWTRFSQLQTDQSLFGICLTGCRPRGDWVMRATWDPVNCPPPTGACCFGTAGCVLLEQAACAGAGGSWKGPGSTCGTNTAGVWSGCVPPPNNPPVANAGPDQSLTDSNNNGSETVIVDGSNSSDPDSGDFIANSRWTEGATLLQDGPAFLSVSLPVGTHTLTLQVTDSQGAQDTDTVVIIINPAACIADFDDGSGTGTPDGGVTIDDLIYYLGLFEAGDVAADVDDGSGTGTRDGGVTIDDLIYFLGRFEAGC